MNNFSPALQHLLQIIRNDPALPELLANVESPRVPRFLLSQAEEVEKARAKWIYESGRRAQHDRWLLILTGEIPPEGDDHEPGSDRAQTNPSRKGEP